MTRAQMRKKAVEAVNARGCLLVYPLANRAEPRSLWSELFPRSKMRWEWDTGGDNRVAELWHLREELSRSNEVVYVKWFQNRATLFSYDLFTHMLAYLRAQETAEVLPRDSRNILEFLQQDSPLSTKQVKAAAELEGRSFEPTYNRAMKPLWQHLLIVGYGEFQDSSFPSLGIGATEVLFEELWRRSLDITAEAGEKFARRKLGETNPFFKFAVKVMKTRDRETEAAKDEFRAEF
jgi:hypothetical protein